MASAITAHMAIRAGSAASPDDGPAKQIAAKVQGITGPVAGLPNRGASPAMPGPSSSTGARAAKSAAMAKSTAQAARTSP